jgi:hypothetical protein
MRRRPGRVGRPPAGTEDWAPTFLAAILRGLHVRDACKEANVTEHMPYTRRDADPVFAAEWEKSSAFGTEMLEYEAGRRAYHGTLEPVYYKGEVCGEIRKYSDTLIMFLLRARLPQKYRDNSKIEMTGKDDGPLLHKAVADLPDITTEEFQALPCAERIRRLQDALHALNRY